MSRLPRSLPFLFGWIIACSAHAAPGTPVVPHIYPDFPTAEKLSVDDEPRPSRVDADGTGEWISSRPAPPGSGKPVPGCSREVTHVRWNPGSGAIEVRTVNTPGWLWVAPKPVVGTTISQTVLPDGFAWLSRCTRANMANFGEIIHGHVLLTETDVHLGDKPVQMIALSSDSAAAITRDPKSRHIIVHVLQRVGDELHDELMPELPIAYNNDFAVAALDANRLMILGGSDAPYRGCMSCRDETHILDIVNKRWLDGPRMLEARSEFSATRLPDGSVLVAGGWTKAAGWGYDGPSRTTERWDPGTNTFASIAPMPVGDADQRGMWMAGRDDKTLMLVDGLSASVPAYDVATATWRIIGAWPRGSERAGCGFFPFFAGGHAYAWAGCNGDAVAEPLRRYWGAVPAPPSSIATGPFLGRGGSAVVSAAPDMSALIIGGSVPTGMTALPTSAVEAMNTQGLLTSMPSLIDAQTGARAKRLHGGVLVFAGWTRRSDRRKKPTPVSMEWLADLGAGSNATWQPVNGTPPATASGIGELADGGLLEVNAKGSVSEIRLALINGKPTLQREPWAPFAQPRHSTPFARMEIRQLADGRIIAAGGDARLDSIAVLEPSTNDPQSADHYQPIGPLSYATTYAIFDPATRQWSASARSPLQSAQTATSRDGRWMKITPTNGHEADDHPLYAIFPSPDANSSEPEHAAWVSVQTAIASNGRVVQITPVVENTSGKRSISIAVSSADGSSWSLLPRASYPHVTLDDIVKLYEVDGEIFVQGRDQRSIDVEWFDPAAGTWQTVWTLPQESYAPAGKLQMTTLPNHHTVLLTEH